MIYSFPSIVYLCNTNQLKFCLYWVKERNKPNPHPLLRLKSIKAFGDLNLGLVSKT